uniref:Reverse transcriptase domain-containing protein n=1 Tax=Tanacetum cinerariifolium TaxID=118510 RepID=A0A699HWW7_TANCI|nr:reverse transcriptase domain-containing protein [Tanacetum cinerariifolium]
MKMIGDRVIGGLKTSTEVFTIIGKFASKNEDHKAQHEEKHSPTLSVKSITQCEVRMVKAIHHLLTLENLYPIDDEPMWAADRVVALTLGFAITIPDTAKEFAIKDFDALLDEGSKILHSIEGTLLKEEIFAKFDEFMAMTVDKNSDFKSDTEEPPFEKITINFDYQIKTSLEQPPMNLKLKPLPDNMEYVFLEEPSFLPVIVSSQLSKEKKDKLVSILKNHKQAFAWKTIDIPGICPSFYKHKVQLLDDKKLIVQK